MERPERDWRDTFEAFRYRMAWAVFGLTALLMLTFMGHYYFSQQAQAASLSGWLNNAPGYTKAMALHQNKGQPVFLYFYAPSCRYCTMLENDLLNTRPVQAYLGSFAKVKVNLAAGKKGSKEHQLAKQLGVRGTPAVFVKFPSRAGFTKINSQKVLGGARVSMTPEEYIRKIKSRQ